MTMKRWIYFIVSACAVVAMCVFIFWMSARSADESGELSMGIVYQVIGFIVPGYDQMAAADQLMWQKALEHPIRKLAHFLEYLALGALVLNALAQGLRARSPLKGLRPVSLNLCIGAWAISTAYAASDELHQMFVVGRAGMISDVILDSCGIAVGVLLCYAILKCVFVKTVDGT